jgi:hypothetical protein
MMMQQNLNNPIRFALKNRPHHFFQTGAIAKNRIAWPKTAISVHNFALAAKPYTPPVQAL